MVLGADDVGQQKPLSVLAGHKAAADAGHRSGDRNAGVHQRKRRAADRSHRGRTVRAHDLGDAADHIREIRRNNLRNRTLGQIAVPDFTPSRTRDAADFADAEVREVVVQIEALFRDAAFTGQVIGFLRVLLVAEGREHERLGFSAREERAAVDHGEYADFGRQRPDLGRRTAVRTELLLEDDVAGRFSDEVVERDRGHETEFGVAHRGERFAQRAAQLGAEFVERDHAGFLARNRADVFNTVGAEFRHRRGELFRNQVELVILLGAAGAFRELDLGLALFLDRVVREVHRLFHLRFGDEIRFAFDHDDLVGTAGVDEFKLAFRHLGAGRVHDELAVDKTDADRADRAVERQVGEHQRGRGADHRKHVRFVHAVGGEQHAGDLDFVEEPFREQRPDRPVDHAAGQDLLGGGTPFALDIAAGKLACRRVFFAVVDLQREEVGAFARSAGAGRREHDGVAEADEAGTVGETGDLAGGDLHLPFAVELEYDFFFSHD